MRTKAAIATQVMREAEELCACIESGTEYYMTGGLLCDMDEFFSEVVRWDDLSTEEIKQAWALALIFMAQQLNPRRFNNGRA